jgi:sugar phosphate permease
MAWWCTNMVLGGFMATSLAAFSVGSAGAAQGAWRRGAWIPSLILVGIAAAFLLLTKDKQSKGERPADGAIRAPLDLKPPLVAIALMYFCVKLVRYSFLFWLPLYMTEALRYSPVRAGYASSIFELAGLAGVLLAGYVSEHLWTKSRFPVGAGMMAVLGCLCVLFPFLSRTSDAMNLIAIALTGAFTFGPDTLMVGAGVQDVAPARSMATSAGFVNGVGSLGQLVSPVLVSRLSTAFGWDTLFAALGIASLVGGLILAAQPRFGRLLPLHS